MDRVVHCTRLSFAHGQPPRRSVLAPPSPFPLRSLALSLSILSPSLFRCVVPQFTLIPCIAHLRSLEYSESG